MTTTTLPMKDDDLSDAIRNAASAGRMARCPQWVTWYVAHWYLKGMRLFQVNSRKNGEVKGFWEVKGSYNGFRYEDVLVKRQRELGRLMRTDVRPFCNRSKMGLQSLRDASIAQVLFDNQVDVSPLESHKLEFLGGLCDYGTMGQAVSTTGGVVDLGFDTDKYEKFKFHLENVYPWQIIPLPARLDGPSQRDGIMRERRVPLEWLKNRKGLSIGRDESELEIMETTPGAAPNDPDNPNPNESGGVAVESITTTRTPNGKKGSKGGGDLVKYATLRETWLYDECGRVARYITQVGRKITSDTKNELLGLKHRPVCPMEVARYFTLGDFWGRSFVDILIPLAQEAEQMWKKLFQNVKDLDQMGLLVVKSNSGITREMLKKTGESPRAVFAEPDYAAPMSRTVEAIQPVNTGDFPGKVAASANALLDRESRESEMFSGNAPGRMDSLPGLGFLYETSLISLIPTGASVALAYRNSWRSLLWNAGQKIGPTDVMQLAMVDDAIAGVVLEDDGTIKVSQNPIPDPDDVDITIREAQPKNITQRKQEVANLFAQGAMPLEDFLWVNVKEGLDIPAGNEEIVNSIRTTMLRLILIFNDGETPRSDRVAPPSYTNHKAAIRTIRAFLNRPEVQYASGKVKDAIVMLMNQHEQWQFGQYPEQMPKPEDSAGAEQQMAELMAQGGGGMQPGMASLDADTMGAGPTSYDQ